MSGEEGAILERLLHFCAGNIVTKVTGALIGVVGLYVCFIGHRLFHIGEHGEFPVISSVVTVLCCMCWLLFILMPTLRGSHSDFDNVDICVVLHFGSTLGMV